MAEINDVEIEVKETRDPKDMKYLRAKELLLHDQLTHLRNCLQPFRAKHIEEAKKYPSGSLPFPGEREVGFEEKAWLDMCSEVQERILLLISSRRQFAQVKALCNMRASMSEAVATDLGIEVLHAADGEVLLGVFNVPALDGIIDSAPKGAFADFVLSCARLHTIL